jgi:hypothetical protein
MRVPITDLGGSLNQGRAPSELGPNEYTAISGFYQFGSKLRRRGGMRRLTTAAMFERITGLVSYKPEVLPPGGVDMIPRRLLYLADPESGRLHHPDVDATVGAVAVQEHLLRDS